MSTLSWLGPTFGLLSKTPHKHGLFGLLRKTGQGAGAGALGLSGAGAFGAHPAPLGVDLSSVEGWWAGLASGAFNAPLQILAAILIFLAAGKCIARLIGLGIVIGAFVLYMQGMRLDDVWPLAQEFWRRLSAAFQAFMNPSAPAG